DLERTDIDDPPLQRIALALPVALEHLDARRLEPFDAIDGRVDPAEIDRSAEAGRGLVEEAARSGRQHIPNRTHDVPGDIAAFDAKPDFKLEGNIGRAENAQVLARELEAPEVPQHFRGIVRGERETAAPGRNELPIVARLDGDERRVP